jgi:hypothetical protein
MATNGSTSKGATPSAAPRTAAAAMVPLLASIGSVKTIFVTIEATHRLQKQIRSAMADLSTQFHALFNVIAEVKADENSR